MHGIPTDHDGILVDVLEETLGQLKGTEEHYKFIYLVPDFQNPAGVTLSLETRKKIIELSKKYDILIIEDTPYRELRFEGQSPPSLRYLDDTNNVLRLHTFSNIFVPGFRLDGNSTWLIL
jgi:2-aminoadipate transaminase